MIKKSIKDRFDTCAAVVRSAIVSGCGVERLTRSFCVGLYIAFSPFPGLHFVMMLISKYLFDLHFPTLFIATSINNPWTLLPFYTGDYVFGYWFVHKLLGLHPTWSISLVRLFGSGSICVWSFLIGGNVLGLLAAFIGYPMMRMLFKRFAQVTVDAVNP
jgi:uncharacterized protein (DUF2062 family)